MLLKKGQAEMLMEEKGTFSELEVRDERRKRTLFFIIHSDMKIRGWANWEQGDEDGEEKKKEENEGMSEWETKPADSEGSGRGTEKAFQKPLL